LSEDSLSRNVQTGQREVEEEQLYVATNLEHVLLPASYPACLWIGSGGEAEPQRRLFYRFTLEVWAWIWQQLAKANARYWEARDGNRACQDLESILDLAAKRMEPLYSWANARFYPPGLRNALQDVKPRLP